MVVVRDLGVVGEFLVPTRLQKLKKKFDVK